MSLVKKKIQEINKKKQIKLTKPIEVHNTYKDLIKKNSIFKDLKDLKKETKKKTPHYFFNLNDNSNNYLAKLKKIDFNNCSYLDLADSEKKEWLGCIIFADVYCRFQDKKHLAFYRENTNIFRIGYSIDHKDFKPNSWFFVKYNHPFGVKKIYDYIKGPFKTYDKMMSSFIETTIEFSREKNIVFKKPIGGFFNLYTKTYEFTESVNITNFYKRHSFLGFLAD